MDLSERQLKILQAVIRNYLETGEPVGSRTISKYTDLSLSSATIRNEMADLEEMGYIIQPHTSAGRIPTDKAYRLYVDTMMSAKTEEIESLRDNLMDKAGRLDHLLKEAAKLLADNTNYVSLVTTPSYRGRRVKFLQLTDVDATHVLLVMVLEGNLVRNKILESQEPVDKEVVLKLNILLNTFLQNLQLSEINLQMVAQMKEQAVGYENIVEQILDALSQELRDADAVEVYTSGATNILKYPELSDKKKAAELLTTFEEKTELTQIMNDKLESENGERGIQVYIGNENSMEAMKDCSVVTATYRMGDGVFGKIGIVGPKRMDYDKVVGTLQNLMNELDEILKK